MDKVPLALEELQIWFANHLTRTFRDIGEFNLPNYSEAVNQEIRSRIAPGPTLSAEQRFGIYNQQYWWRLFVLLQEAYPTLVRLFGFRDFNTLIAEPYFLRYPPNDWFLPHLGTHLMQWISEEYDEEDRKLLINIADIDAAYERLYHAINPESALFELNADFFSFRSSLLEHTVNHWQQNDLPKLDCKKGTYYFILSRTEEGVFYESIEKAYFDEWSASKLLLIG